MTGMHMMFEFGEVAPQNWVTLKYQVPAPETVSALGEVHAPELVLHGPEAEFELAKLRVPQPGSIPE